MLGLLVITMGGTLGFVLIEDASLLDALYLTVITISTVGYREPFPLSPEGKLFAIALIVVGVGAGLYFLSIIGESILEGRLRDIYRRGTMLREINRMRDHVIVCGFGRFGRIVTHDLQTAGSQVVVIEQDPALESELEGTGQPYVLGSATADRSLEQAGIANARAIVIAVPSESDCVFITLAARELNPDILINARSETDAAVRRIRQAGADHVTSPLKIGGGRAAMSILRPTVVDFLELSSSGGGEEIDLEEIRIEPGAPVEGHQISDLEKDFAQVRIIAIKHDGERIQIIPGREHVIGIGDHLVVIGERNDLAALALRAQSRTS